MTQPVIRVVVATDAYSEEAVPLALAYAAKIAEIAAIQEPEVIFLTHTKQQIRSGAIASALGAQTSKALANNKAVGIQGGGRISNQTMKTMPQFATNKIVVVCYGEEKILDFADGLSAPAGIVVIPDLEGSANGWIERWNPTVHGAEQSEASEIVDDPIIRAALTSLSEMINLSTGLSHPRDKLVADEILRVLRAKGHVIEPSKIKSWAIRNGWAPDGANELAKVAGKVAKLKTKPNLSKIHDPNGRYERWKSD